MSHVKLIDIDKHYGGYHALRSVNLSVDKGEFIVMVGPSGCGKSTTLKTIAGLENISSGEIWINGRDVTREEPGDRGIAMVFQSYALYPHMTVAENMGFGLKMAKRPQSEIDAAVKRAAEILRISDQLDKRPKQLSGGQRQRVAIGRAITRSPEVFLFDEPLSNLDAALRTQMRVELSTLHQQLGSTMIYVTHDQVEAMTMASRIVVFNKGIIEQEGAPLNLYHNPANQFVAGFLGAPRINFVNAKLVSLSDGIAEVALEGGDTTVHVPVADVGDLKAQASLTLGIRPESLKMGALNEDTAISFNGKVGLVEQLGRETILYVDAGPLATIGSESGTRNFTVQLGNAAGFSAGEQIKLSASTSSLYLFGPDGRTLSRPKSIIASL
ncbi:ABC transporter ATP-binding protein [Rhizobium sp. NBRC 114257]|uniref:ABC transporter ATP-binding protein n=1 Tax=Rhizobium dioscoreae TaxID=2653122 RepID=A0ABQ0Z745_9HYPH|nr:MULTISPECIES: ABC transporter ATP-binding protein [Rhizobium]GES51320.1 ABC transporter ATP-binding protein [Rhizobium dioscoreae]GLU82772.1 ABC transporter ATP-binding protein [Rhizobium sp. NBRC 114257]